MNFGPNGVDMSACRCSASCAVGWSIAVLRHRASMRCDADRLRTCRLLRFLPLCRCYDSETNTTNAKTDRNIRATTPKKIPKITGSSLRFGLNVEPRETFASSGRSGS